MYKVCSLFAGVGGIDIGFLNTKKCNIVYANEFDKFAQRTYELNFKNKIDCRDIHEVKLEEIPEFDIMVGGFPCTSFSVAGYRKGFEDEKGFGKTKSRQVAPQRLLAEHLFFLKRI